MAIFERMSSVVSLFFVYFYYTYKNHSMKKVSKFFENAGKSLKSIGEIGALILLLYHLMHDMKMGNEKIALIGVIGVLSISAIITIIFSFRKGHYKRNAKIAKALPFVNAAFSEIHSIMRKTKIDPEDYVVVLTKFCNRISEAFYEITGKHCHVCIKISLSDAKTAYVKTIARERRLPVTNHDKPIRSAYDKHKNVQHSIEDNTDFEVINENILINEKRYFFCNNLSKLEGYKNSSFKFHKLTITGPEKKIWWKFWKKKAKWPLDYKSTMVAGICPEIAERGPDDKLVGFLCIDCEDKNVFLEDEDINLLIGCANGLYNVVGDSKKVDDGDVQAAGVAATG